MHDVNWVATSLKLNRHKVYADYLEDSNTLHVGKMRTSNAKLLQVFLPFGLSVVLFGLGNSNALSSNDSNKALIVAAVMFAAGIFGLITINKLNRSNQNEFVVSPGLVKIGNDIEIPLNGINQIKVQYSNNERLSNHAELLIVTQSGEETVLFGLIDDAMGGIRNDMEYLKKFIENILYSPKLK